MVPAPVMGPPVRPVPVATLVTVPEPPLLSAAQTQLPDPLVLRISPAAQGFKLMVLPVTATGAVPSTEAGVHDEPFHPSSWLVEGAAEDMFRPCSRTTVLAPWV